MDASSLVKLSLIGLFLASVLFVHFRGRVKLPFLRQLVNHSAVFAPYNALMYLFSRTPPKPYIDRQAFPELQLLRDHWPTIREEALQLMGTGHIKAAEKNNDAGFNSFFKRGWRRFYLTWYGNTLPSAEQMCPKTVALLQQVPQVKGAMFALLPGRSQLTPHRDPFAGSLRYHLGLATPNSDDCAIWVDGEVYAWRDGEDVIFDETYVHWVNNDTDVTRIILMADLERPLRTRWMGVINHLVSGVLGRGTAPQNVDGERVGAINQTFALTHRLGKAIGAPFRALKQRSRTAYKIVRALLAVLVLALLVYWVAG